MCPSVLTFIFLAVSVNGFENRKQGNLERNKRFFGIFNIVKFPNDICPGTNNQMGMCLSINECNARGLQSVGECASGFGSCCTNIPKISSLVETIRIKSKLGYLQIPHIHHETINKDKLHTKSNPVRKVSLK